MLYAGVLLQALVLAYLVFGEPFYGRLLYRDLKSSAGFDPGARRRFYQRIIRLEWGLVLAVVLGADLRGQPLAALGLRFPDFAGPSGDATFGIVTVVLLGGVVIGLVLPVVLAAVSAKAHSTAGKQLGSIGPMLPATGAERWQFAAVAITAGICEELLFRGLLLAAMAELFPSIPVWASVLAAGAVFGAAHLYQGRRGVLSTGILGVVFAAIYLVVHSLYPLMLVHALVDLRVLALMAVANRRRPTDAAL